MAGEKTHLFFYREKNVQGNGRTFHALYSWVCKGDRFPYYLHLSVPCSGDEPTLLRCHRRTLMTAPCQQGQDVGVLSDKVLSDFMCISFHFSRFVTKQVPCT